MKQEASKKSKKWLWLVLGLVLLLAVAGVVLALVFGGGSSGGSEDPTGGRPELYWNVARQSHLDPETGLSIREAAEDGLFYITFAYNGEQVEYPVSDKRLVNYIDSMDIMSLIFDNDGVVVDVVDPKEVATEVGKNLYVQSVSGNMLVANSSIMMNGMRFNINITELTEVYEVSGAGEFEGVKIDASTLLAMDTITVYANDLEEVTHIYLSNHPAESKVYWRATQQWNSTEKATSREPDENGYYTLDFFCEGELVYFKTKDVAIATKIDGTSRYSAHFGLRFDEDGYIVEVLNSATATRTLLACQRFDITEFDGTTFTASRLLTNDGSYYTGTINEDTVVYDVSGAAKSEGRAGKQVDSIQMGDRVCVWTDTNGNVVLIYVANRLVDSPAYYLPTRKYSSKTAMTTLEPNSRGVYEIEMLREGDSENTIYKTTDVELVNQIMKPSDKCVGLKVDENNNIIYVYDVEALFGYTYFCRGRYISETAGVIASFMLPSDKSVKNGVLTGDCKIYNVSKVGDYGAETTLQVGDYVYAWKQPTGEIVHIYVIRRYVGEDTQYYCLDTEYDTEAQRTTRKHDADGWYHLTMAHMGKKIVLKTKDIDIVNAIDSLRSSVPIASLEVSGDVITSVLDATYATGGAKVASGYRIKSFNADGSITAYYKEKEVTFTLAEDVQIYNVSAIVSSHQGEKGSLKLGDMITAYTNWEGDATIVWIRGRQVDNMYWKVDRFYNSTDACTTRVPDADGWYWYDLAVNGEVKTFKTKDITVANSMDKYEGAFGLHVVGDEIKGFVGVSSVKDASGNGVTNWTVTGIKGNQVTVTYTYSGSTNTGKSQTITLSSNAKIYDVSASAKSFGEKTTLKVGDLIRTYLSKDGESHQYVYIRARSNREGGYMSYCDHCDQVVYWNPYITNSSLTKYDSHYYLPGDIENTSQISVGSEARDFENVLDLNGYTLSRNNGRMFLARYGDTLTIIDTVGGGSISGAGNAANGGVIMVSDGILNLHAGTVQLTDDENVKPLYGGCVYVTGENAAFNMYGGTIQNGRSYIKSEKYGAYGGNVYVTRGTFNMTGGTITGGNAFDGIWEVKNDDGTVTEKTMRGYGGNIYFATDVTVNITGGTITGGHADYYGGNIFSSTPGNVVNISNATITKGDAYRGGNFYGNGSGTWNNVTITDGKATDRFGNVMFSNGTWTLDGGTKITGGVSEGRGGNMGLYYGTLNLNKCTIDGGVAQNGAAGNLYALYDAVINVNKGAVMSNGTASTNGGNIYIAREKKTDETEYRLPTLNLNGGSITGGTAATGNNVYANTQAIVNLTSGTIDGDVYLNGNNTVSVSGNPKVTAGAVGGLILPSNVLLKVGTMTNGASVAVTPAAKVFTEAFVNAQAYVGYFSATEEGMEVQVTADSELCVGRVKLVDPNAYPAYCEHCKQDDVMWHEWSYYSGDGHYYLNDTYTLIDSPVTIMNGEDVVIDLKGLSITAQDDLAFKVNGKLSIVDSGEGGLITGTGPSSGIANGGVILVDGADAELNLYGGVLKMTQTNYSTAGGGVLYVKSGATFNMYGGELAGGVSNGDPDHSNSLTKRGRGGNLYVTGSTANLIGGKIHSGVAGVGANIYSGSSSIVNISGTEISGGTANYRGGNIYSESGALTISGGSVTGGTATNGGNNMYLTSSNLTVNITGGTMDGTTYIQAATAVNVSGDPTVNNLSLKSGILLTLGEMTGGSVKVTADGVFTNAVTNANDYLSYFSAYASGKKVAVTTADELTIVENTGDDEEVIDPADTPFNDVYAAAVKQTTDGVFASGETVTAPCPYCSANGDTADKQWTVLGANQTGAIATLSGGHYYLAESIENNHRYTVTGEVCLHLNGHDMTTADERNFYVEGTLTVMGNGTLTGGKTASNGYNGANIDSVGIVNLCGGTYLRTVNTSVVCGRGTTSDATALNIYEGTTIQGDSTTNGQLVTAYGKTTLNIYGGTITGGTGNGTGGNIYVKPNTYTSRKTTLNIYGGTISNGTDTLGGNIYVEGGTSVINVTITGGTITGGSVYVDSAVSSLAVSGAAVIENLDLSDGTIVNLGTLTADADIAVTAPGVFTGVLSNASDYLTYVSAYEEGKKVAVTTSGELTIVEDTGSGSGGEEPVDPADTPFNDVYTSAVKQTTDGVFASGETVTAPCPYCSANGDTADKEWTALAAVTGTSTSLSDGHYFLADSITGNAGYYNITGNACVHLNGNDITTAAGKLAFYATATGTLNVMGEGTVTGGRRHSSNPSWAATLDSVGVINLCGGTWKRANNAPVIGGRGTGVCQINIYDGTLIQGDSDYTEYALVSVNGNTALTMYGGTITGGTWTGGNGGNIRVFNSGNTSRVSSVTIYGGLVTNGSATLGGNIYVEGGNGYTNLELAGGTVTDGSVYVKVKGSTLTVSGNAQVENLDLSDGTILNINDLSATAHVGITAPGEFTDVLTNAGGYLGNISAYETGKKIAVTSDQKLTVQEDTASYANGYCPCGCGVALDQIQWTSVSFDADPTADYKIQANGHYRLESDVRGNTTNLIRVYADKVVFDMNGKKIENKGRAFYHGDNANCDLYILDTVGSATVTTIDYSDSALNNGGLTGCWFYTKGTLSVYGGSWSSTTTVAGTSTSSPRMACVWTGTLNIYGGTFDATGIDAACGIMGAYKETAATLNIYGGSFIEGNGSDLGNIFRVNAASTLNIMGGEFDGQIFTAAPESTVNISGDVQINNLDLSNGGNVNIGMLTKDASVVLNGTGELTAANANAQTYIDAGYISAYEGTTLSVEDDVIIGVAAATE